MSDTISTHDMTNEQLHAAILAAGWQCDGYEPHWFDPAAGGIIIVSPQPLDVPHNDPRWVEWECHQIVETGRSADEAWANIAAHWDPGQIGRAWTPEQSA